MSTVLTPQNVSTILYELFSPKTIDKLIVFLVKHPSIELRYVDGLNREYHCGIEIRTPQGTTLSNSYAVSYIEDALLKYMNTYEVEIPEVTGTISFSLSSKKFKRFLLQHETDVTNKELLEKAAGLFAMQEINPKFINELKIQLNFEK